MPLYDTAPGAAASALGSTALIYRYTVAGSAKASIDTGVDTAQAGSNDWTNGDLLEVFIDAQTTDAGVQGNFLAVTLNNDTGSNYDQQQLYGNNATTAAGVNLAAARWTFGGHGAGGLGSYASHASFVFANYAGTTFYKNGKLENNYVDSTGPNSIATWVAIGYRSTSAITRLKLAAASANLAVGSQLLIYKRVAS